ncbi:hypothetical protein [Endothiovibrio diazotrophicus]
MTAIKISSKVEEATWNEFRAFARDSHRNISGLLTEALQDYLTRHKVRPDVLQHLEESMDEHQELGRLLAK